MDTQKANATQSTDRKQRSDDDIHDDILGRLGNDPAVDVSNIDIVVASGHVVLNGTIPEERGKQRVGRKIAVVGLTKPGKRFIGEVLPRHSKMVKALMRAISGRQQRVLSAICRQLRAGDIVRFVREIRMQEVEED